MATAKQMEELWAAISFCQKEVARLEQLEQTDPAITDWMREHRAGLIEYHRTMAAEIRSRLDKATGVPPENPGISG